MMKWSELSTDERNRLIHTKVMSNPEICDGRLRCVSVDVPSRSGGVAFSYFRALCSACDFTETVPSENKLPEEHAPRVGQIPHYSTDMNAAWQIVEKMRGGDFWIAHEFCRVLQSLCEKKELTNVGEGPHLIWFLNIDADRIVLAALKARGVEMEP